jgi:hypothetical protein
MGLKKTIQDAVVDSRKGEHSVARKILEQHVSSLANRKVQFNDMAAHISRYEQLLYEAVAAHSSDMKTNPEQAKRAHELVVMTADEMKKIKAKLAELTDHMKFE